MTTVYLRWLFVIRVTMLLGCVHGTLAVGDETFDGIIAPLLARRCLECHNSSDRKGELDLTSIESAKRGGENGAVLPSGVGRAAAVASTLWQRVVQNEMPPRHPLTETEKNALLAWLVRGAPWDNPIDRFRFTTEARAGYDWWALRPLRKSSPDVKPDDVFRRTNDKGNLIDRWVQAKLRAEGLSPAAPADKRTLLRRLSYTLLGLPPTPEEVHTFLADDAPGAVARQVDRLLASPHYGERWARHWLDVVHFGESQGFERDKIRTNAWPYRDWLIGAFNEDMPYDEFVRQQVAGDVLYPGNASAQVATGFLVAGPYDEVGQNQLSIPMRAVVRQDELEDLVGMIGQTFLGLTVNCARCHDHKFDPITQVDYFRLTAALAGVRHGEREIRATTKPVSSDKRAERVELLRSALLSLENSVGVRRQQKSKPMPVVSDSPPPRAWAAWSFNKDARDHLGNMHLRLHGGAKVERGSLILDGVGAFASSPPLSKPLRESTLSARVMLSDLEQRGGGVISVQNLNGHQFHSLVYGERETGHWLAGSEGFARTSDVGGKSETDALRRFVHVALVYSEAGKITLYRDGRRYGNSYTVENLPTFVAGMAQIVLGLRHGAVDAGGLPTGRVLAGAIDEAAVFDRALSAVDIARLAGVTVDLDSEDANDEWLNLLTDIEKKKRDRLILELSHDESQLALEQGRKCYAVTPGVVETSHVLHRGNPGQRLQAVTAGGVAALGENADFALNDRASDADRRRRLADWLTAPDNPLLARVIVNRVWHYHFGVGIVDTPNDFGFNGGRPSHAELLDELARELIRNRWSIKSLHRLILLSATYQQSGEWNKMGMQRDAGNRWLWRKNALRLDAESLRDAMLLVAGELNPRMGGPGFQDFRTFSNNSQFYEIVDLPGAAFQRRSIYRTWVRSGTNPFLDVHDCPDPSTTTPKRAVTTTPLQALALLNSSFALRMAERFADRVARESFNDKRREVERTYELAFARLPRPEEIQDGMHFIRQHGLAGFCRVIFNSNEFLYVD